MSNVEILVFTWYKDVT